MLKKKLLGLVPDVTLLLGAAVLAYGCWLAWRPLGYIFGGLFIAAMGIFLDRNRVMAERMGRRM